MIRIHVEINSARENCDERMRMGILKKIYVLYIYVYICLVDFYFIYFFNIHLIHEIVICTLQVRQFACHQDVTYAIYSFNLAALNSSSNTRSL